MEALSVRPKNIMVFGDIMLDVKMSGSTHKMANEAPIPVLLRETEKKYLGGCGNVLMNLQALGCEKLFIVSRIGNDFYGSEIKSILANYPEVVQHLYNYLLIYHKDKMKIRQLKWDNRSEFVEDNELNYISCHWYMK
jgi:bifunctional ADP-heptose synthase (sugar kinase/adenylyltransferase)